MPNEWVAQHMSELRRLSQDYNFEATQNKMLRDMFVLGGDVIQRRLLTVQDLDLDKAV